MKTQQYAPAHNTGGSMDTRRPELDMTWDRGTESEVIIARFSLILDSDRTCESPIEAMFLAALLEWSGWVGIMRLHVGPGVVLVGMRREGWEGFTVERQLAVGPYRVDFVVRAEGAAPIIVECDGHDFHDRTKEQAARDKRRDRELQQHGYLVFRFTGSELNRNALACAKEVMQALGLVPEDMPHWWEKV